MTLASLLRLFARRILDAMLARRTARLREPGELKGVVGGVEGEEREGKIEKGAG